MKFIKEYLSGLTELLYPRICPACDRSLSANDISICSHCLSQLPETNFHEDKENETAKMFWGRMPVIHATSFIRFEKGGMTQRIMHQLKYKGHKQLGIDLGMIFGDRLTNTSFASCDLIIPVPLHRRRFQVRGYNQSSLISHGIGQALNIPYQENILVRKLKTKTQTVLNKYERWENVEKGFLCINPTFIIEKHILLVDDVITTGATIEACGSVLLNAGARGISVATLCYAS